jgi:hypothetical protein
MADMINQDAARRVVRRGGASPIRGDPFGKGHPIFKPFQGLVKQFYRSVVAVPSNLLIYCENAREISDRSGSNFAIFHRTLSG